MNDSTQLSNNDQATELPTAAENTQDSSTPSLTSEDPVALIPAQRAEATTQTIMLRDRNGRFIRREPVEPLPDFVTCLSAVPGGLGVELPTTFDFAGVRWTPADAAFDGSPIGFRLAVELAHLSPTGSPEASPAESAEQSVAS